MYVCIWCGKTASALYRRFNNGITKLSHCITCGNVVDIYTEYDSVLLLLDILLHKSTAFKHVLFNRNLNIQKRLFMLYLVCDTYIKLVQLPYSSSSSYKENCYNWHAVLERDFLWVFALTLSEYFINFSVIYLLVTFLCYYRCSIRMSLFKVIKMLLLSSYGKLFNMAAAVWGANELLLSIWLTNIFVITSNAQALNVTLEISWRRSLIIVLTAVIVTKVISGSVQIW